MVYEIIEEIAATSSKNKKLEILNYHKNNNILQRVIKMAYDPFLNFWIKKIPEYSAEEIGVRSINQGLDQLETLASREVTGNAAIERLKHILESQDAANAVIIERIIGKDLRAGFSAGTANKVWPNLVMEWPVMLCSQFEQRLIDRMTWPAILQLKADGLRIAVIVNKNKVEYFTRNGKPMDLMGKLDSQFLQLAKGDRLVFDGELLIIDKNNIVNRQTGNGIAVKSQKGTLSDKEADLINITLWDVIPLDMFLKEKAEVPYRLRWEDLQYRYNQFLPKKINLIPTNLVNSLEETINLFEIYLSRGLEGAILKDPEGIWENKRSRACLKLKGELDCDLLCTGIEEGSGKYSGKIGALILESSDGKIKTHCGSGLTDLDREIPPNEIIGKIITVKYNARISKKGSEIDSLFLPIFKCIREITDKNEADISINIK